MTKEDWEIFYKELDEAETAEARTVVKDLFLKKLASCSVHNSDRTTFIIKNAVMKEDLKEAMRQFSLEMSSSIAEINKKIEALHKSPKFKESPIEWLKYNWMWLCALLVSLKAMDLFEMFEKLLHIGH